METVVSTQSAQASSSPTTTSSPQQQIKAAELPCIPASVPCRERERVNKVAQGVTGGHTVIARGGGSLLGVVRRCGVRIRSSRVPQQAARGHKGMELPTRGSQYNNDTEDGRKLKDAPNQQGWMWIDTHLNENNRPREIPFEGNTGLTIPVPQDAKPYNFFKLYFTNDVIEMIFQETNRYAQQYITANADTLQRRSMVKTWKPTNVDEIQAFLGLCIMMGLMNKSRVWVYWSMDAFYSIPVFSQVISRDRFQLILKFQHCQENEDVSGNLQDAGTDGLFKIIPMIVMLRQRFNTVFYPPEDITVDGSLILFRGRLMFKQYIKNKRDRYGVNLSRKHGNFTDST